VSKSELNNQLGAKVPVRIESSGARFNETLSFP
jgi:hypothetical protein